MLTDTKLKNLKATGKAYKVADRDGLYVFVTASGTVSFRLDYRINGRRETLTIGKYGADGIGLAVARERATAARKQVVDGISPSKEKARKQKETRDAKTMTVWADEWLTDYQMADSTRAMRKSILDRDILPAFGKRLLTEIETIDLRELCDKIKARGAPSTAVHAREIVMNVFRYAIGRGEKVKNPADDVQASAIATFKPKDRALSPDEIRVFLDVLDTVGTLPTIKLALRFILLTMARKGELLNAIWDEVDFEAAIWTIPKERMKARRPHVVYLPQQGLDILVALKTCAGGSRYLLPSRYDADKPLSDATLNRVIDVVVEKAKAERLPLEKFTVHDLRRTGSTLLHEAGFNSDWIEKCLAHEQRGVRAVYNKAEYAEQRRDMLQQWANMIDGWVKGAKVVPLRRAA